MIPTAPRAPLVISTSSAGLYASWFSASSFAATAPRNSGNPFGAGQPRRSGGNFVLAELSKSNRGEPLTRSITSGESASMIPAMRSSCVNGDDKSRSL